MTILPLDPSANATPEALRAFLAQCRAAAAGDGRPRLVSISLEVEPLDPLAVLESIFEPGEPHFYAERPAEGWAVAGAEAVLAFETHGPERFEACQQFIDEVLGRTIAVGEVGRPFSGPHFLGAFTFLDEVETGEPFPPVRLFVPRWQVARTLERTVAVANLVVEPAADLDALTTKVWRAHGKFRAFDYGEKGGTGVPPVEMGVAEIRHGAYLPHWTCENATYAVTFRLADSLPVSVVQAWREEREAIVQRAVQQGRPLSSTELERLDRLHSEKVEAYLDAGAGVCHLRKAEIATVVSNALRHFDGERYELHEWCVMPNHVHVIVKPLTGHSLSGILHGWKSYTAKEANRLLGQTGEFWQPEYYDHLIRNQTDYTPAIDYIRRNPERAGLVNWPWRGCGLGVPPVESHCEEDLHGQDVHATRQVHGQAAHATNGVFVTRETGDYRRSVARAVELIADGRFNKIVLARCKELTAATRLHPLKILNGLRQRFPDCYAFSFANGRGQSFIGASPERLLRVEAGRLFTEALAGSAPRGRTASEDAALGGRLLHDGKELREHRLVLESITRRLTALGLQPAHPERPVLRGLANVQHLHTPVSAALPAGVRLLDALAQLHPTPAVGGSPREAARAQIRALEAFPRGLYGGALGWIDHRGGGEFLVGIRSALIDGVRARVYAGGGIVAGSEPEKEFAETELKFHALLDALLA
jgi:menaquinone-specific isochorismate synthase